jgi:hypothetical protein
MLTLRGTASKTQMLTYQSIEDEPTTEGEMYGNSSRY